MPEGPEVSFMRNELNKKFKNCNLLAIKIVGGRYKRHGIPKNIQDFINKKLPIKIIEIKNKGKLLYIKLENNNYIIITLGMTGHLIQYETDHTHYHFNTNCGTFYLEDVRNFGTLNIMNESELQQKLTKIGPDLLNEKITDVDFIKILRKKNNKPIGEVLLDQKVVSGVGNYLRADSLYMSKISPFRLIKDISDKELKYLKKIIQLIMKKAFKSHIQHKYMRSYKFLVYGRKITDLNEPVITSPCCKNRSIYWVPSVQI